MLRRKILSDISAQIQTASHGHKPQETLRDEEETKDKPSLPSFFTFQLLLLLLQESLFWPLIIYLALKLALLALNLSNLMLVLWPA